MANDAQPWLDEYLLSKPGVTKDFKEEWGWLRYQVGGKLFAARMRPSAEHDPQYAGKDLLNVKCDPMYAELLRREHSEILPGFYMNKQNWNAIYLEGDLSPELLKELCDASYRLVFEKLTKKLQKELLGGTV